ncbi:right-handed parallel beta-helix repeat-containing protein [Planctomycetota bacterium]
MRSSIHYVYLIFALLSVIVCSRVLGEQADKATLYVSANGNDTWSGRMDSPFASLRAARDAARKLNQEQPQRIIVLEGNYFLSKPLELDARDSGISIEAAPGAQVALYGGRKVSGWKKDGDNFYSIDIPEVKDGTFDFRALVVNNKLSQRARLPKKGTYSHLNPYIEKLNDDGTEMTERPEPVMEAHRTMKYNPADIGPWLDVKNAEIRLYHMWNETLVGVAANDTQQNELKFSIRPLYAPGMYGMKKYIVWNVREGMTEAGQWYLDRTAGKLVYWPLPGEDINEVEAIVPIVESIIRIQGTEETPAINITIGGIKLSTTHTPMITGGFGAGKFDGAVSLVFAEDCKLVELEVFNVSGYGIKARRSNFRVENCHIHHTGAGGICSSGHDIVITNNHVHDVGLIYPSGIGIWGGGIDAHISHNEVHDTTYSGIDYGGSGHLIENNLIYRVMTELHDGGGIRVPGRIHLEDSYSIHSGNEVVIRGNFVRDIEDKIQFTGAWSFFLDANSKNCLLEGNLSVNVSCPSQNHMSKNHTFRNNFFIANVDGPIQLDFPLSSGQIFEKNVVYTTGSFGIANPDGLTTFSNNVLFSEKGQMNYHKLKDYATVGVYPLEATQGNIFSDPMLIDYEKGVVRLAPDSPVYKLGIVPVDVSSAGRRQ